MDGVRLSIMRFANGFPACMKRIYAQLSLLGWLTYGMISGIRVRFKAVGNKNSDAT